MINLIKEKIKNSRNKLIKLKVYSGRGKYEVIEGYICDVFDRIWTFKTNTILKSFTYVDVLLKDVEICS